MEALLQNMDDLRAKGREGGGKAVTEKWKARGKGKLTARERVDALLDPNSPFMELSALAGHEVYPDPLPAAGIITGIGESSAYQLPLPSSTVTGGANGRNGGWAKMYDRCE